jgi:hypothetical protein
MRDVSIFITNEAEGQSAAFMVIDQAKRRCLGLADSDSTVTSTVMPR